MQIISITVAAVLLLPAAHVPQQSAEGFPDVPKTHWAYEAVTALKEQGILIGYPPSQPANTAPRAMPRSGRSPAPRRSTDRRVRRPVRIKPQR